MENTTLLALAEAEREGLIAALNADRSPEAAQAQVERALNRAMMRYVEQCSGQEERDAAQQIVGTLVSALPLMDSVGEARRWNREAGSGGVKSSGKPLSLGLLGVAAALELGAVLGASLSGGGLFSPVAALGALIPALLGAGAAYRAGIVTGRPRGTSDAAPQTREEFLIDPEKVWRHLRGMLLLADRALERLRAEGEIRRDADAQPGGALERDEIELFSGLLESAAAMDGPDAREMTESLRFYLHGRGVEVAEYAPGRESWFEFLPASRPGTIRPALTARDRLLKKGLAAR